MTERVLIVEDDEDIAAVLRMYFEAAGFDASVALSGEAALESLDEGPWSLVILDLNLPGMDGLSVLRELRLRGAVPVIIASARSEESDTLAGLALGADEYVAKPFSPKVLVARARALLRRASLSGQDAPSPSAGPAEAAGAPAAADGDARSLRGGRGGERYRFGPYEFSVDEKLLRRSGDGVALARREFELLLYLLRNAGEPRTPAEIYASVWGNRYGDLASVAVHIRRLRSKIEEDPARPVYLRTQYGYGYKFAAEALE